MAPKAYFCQTEVLLTAQSIFRDLRSRRDQLPLLPIPSPQKGDSSPQESELMGRLSEPRKPPLALPILHQDAGVPVESKDLLTSFTDTKKKFQKGVERATRIWTVDPQASSISPCQPAIICPQHLFLPRAGGRWKSNAPILEPPSQAPFYQYIFLLGKKLLRSTA